METQLKTWKVISSKALVLKVRMKGDVGLLFIAMKRIEKRGDIETPQTNRCSHMEAPAPLREINYSGVMM